jgi:3-oxoadipate enol-lactonase
MRRALSIDPPYTTAVRDEGRGPVVVLVHGTPLDAVSWDGVVERLAPRCRVITYDLRGHGSARACEVPDAYGTLADDLARLLDALEIEQAHVAGHSFGGQVAMSFAAAHADRLRALTVVCSRIKPFPPFAAAADEIDAGGMRAVSEAMIARWWSKAELERDAPVIRYARSCFGNDAAPAFAAALRLLAPFDLGDRLDTFRAPARFVGAQRDVVAIPEDLGSAAARLPRGEFVFERDAGHMLPTEHPGRIADLAW